MSGTGLGAATAFYLGTVSADSARSSRDFLDRMRQRKAVKQEENLINQLTAKAEEFIAHIEWQSGIMEQRRARIAELEEQLTARDALIGEWEQYRDGMERNHTRLRAWSNDAETELKRYHELYGRLPPVQTPDK